MNPLLNTSSHEMKLPNIVSSQGNYLIAEDGKHYLDMECGEWSTPLGHGNRAIQRVIAEQSEKLIHTGFCYGSPVTVTAAETVLDLVDCKDGKCLFLSSGSEAVEVCRQMSRTISDKGVSLRFHDAYLGAYDSFQGDSWYLFNWEKCEECSGECDSCELVTSIPEDVSEFVFEPGSSSGFVKFPPNKTVTAIADKVQSSGGNVIVNEVSTGTGRTGKWFGYQHYDMTPDFIAIGKGIGNGYPVSIAIASKEKALLVEQREFRYGQSHQNDPLGAAVVSEVVRQIRSGNLVEIGRLKGEELKNMLEPFIDGECVISIRGKGLMIYIDLMSKELGDMVQNELLEKGFIVGNRMGALRIDPPFTITSEEIHSFVDAFKDALERTKEKLWV